MTRPQRLAFVTMLLTLLSILIGGLPHAAGSGLVHGDAGIVADGAWWLAPGSGSVVSAAYLVVTVLAVALALLTATTTWHQAGASPRSRRLAWLTAVLYVAAIAAVLALGASWPPLTASTVAPVVSTVLLGLTFVLSWSIADDRAMPALRAVAGHVALYPRDGALIWLTRLGLGALLLVIVSGAVTGAALGPLPCPSWPLCVEDGLLPDQPTTAVWLHMGHRLLTIVAAVVLFAITYRAWSRPAPWVVRRLTLLVAAVLVVQILLGGNLVAAGGAAWLNQLHLLAGVLLWLATIALALVAPRMVGAARRQGVETAAGGSGAADAGAAGLVRVTPASAAAITLPLPGTVSLGLPDYRAIRATIADYLALMKPGILTLLLVTTFAAMLIAAAGLPPFGLVCITILGGVLVAGGANVLNCYIDRDIDAQMARTRHRATASSRVSPVSVLIFGLGLTASAVVLLGIGVNWVAALLALAGNLYYVLVYTSWLKRRTPHNVVIGGAAGAVPPLVGWAAVTGDLSPVAWMLFAIIFMWTPPHSWALALLKQGEYGRAAVPMLPVVAGEAATRKQIVIYTVLLVLVCLALVPLGLGPVYLAAAVLINTGFLGLALLLYWRPSKRHARQLFFGSLWYLALIFLAAVIDRLVIG